MERIIECVPNFSEGRNKETIKAITDAIEKSGGVKILNVDPGEATNRTVVTFVGSPESVVEAAFRGVRKAWVLRAVWWIQWCSFTVASYFVFAVSGMAGVSEMFYIGTLTQTAEAALIQYASCYLGE